MGETYRTFFFKQDEVSHGKIICPMFSICCLRMHYVGTFKRTGEIFDSSKKAGQPIGFQVGRGQAGARHMTQQWRELQIGV